MPLRAIETPKKTTAPRRRRAARMPRPLGPACGAGEYAALLELTHALFATLDAAGRVMVCSGVWEECLGRTREEIIGHSILDFVAPADRKACRTHLERVLAGHPAEEFSIRFKTAARGTIWLALRARLGANLDCLHVLGRDVTAEKVIADEPPRADLVLDELEEGVLIADATRPGIPILQASAGFTHLTGYAPAEILNRPLSFASGPATDHAALQDSLARALRGERVITEVCYHRKDGAPVWLRLHLRPVVEREGSVRQIIAVHLDVSERRIVFDALREKNQALTEALQSLQKTKEAIVQRERMHAIGKMASGIVHDFNNLLAPILGFTELMLSVPEVLHDTTKVVTYLQKIRTAANDGASVVGRLREFYRSRSDSEPPVEFSMRKAVEEVLDLTRHRWRNEAQAEGRSVEVIADLQETPAVFGSVSEVRQAMTNLVLNAVDAMPEGGTLSLRTYTVGKWVCVQISDTGPGMSEEVRRRCFEPFFTTKGKSGTGLGLAIVFGIIERHHGRVDLRSEVGEGTTFTLWLPEGNAPANVDRVSLPAATHSGRPLRVLLVDDEDLLLEVVSQHLLNMGHFVDSFTDPKSALESFYKQPYELVITDRAMPGMSGDQLAKSIREFKADTPVVLLTGFGNIIKNNGEALENIDEVLSKPLSHQTLCDVVVRCGGRCSSSAAAAAS